MLKLSKGTLGLLHVSTGIEMICKIPNMIENAETPEERTAFLECWSINMRLMIEFFEIDNKPNVSKDFSYKLYKYEKLDCRSNDQELIFLKELVSKFVVHFGLARIDNTNSKYNNFDVQKIREYSLLLLPEIKSFVSYVSSHYTDDYKRVRLFVDEALLAIEP